MSEDIRQLFELWQRLAEEKLEIGLNFYHMHYGLIALLIVLSGYMPFELMYGQKPIMPTEETILSWSSIPWMEDMEHEDLLALRIRQLERRQEDVDKAVERLKKARLKSKEQFDKRHRLRPREIKEGDWVLVFDSNLENQYTAMRKMVKRWFGPYIVLRVFDNATYKLKELDGAKIRIPIAGKRIKIFKKRSIDLRIKDLAPDFEGNEYINDEETQDVELHDDE